MFFVNYHIVGMVAIREVVIWGILSKVRDMAVRVMVVKDMVEIREVTKETVTMGTITRVTVTKVVVTKGVDIITTTTEEEGVSEEEANTISRIDITDTTLIEAKTSLYHIMNSVPDLMALVYKSLNFLVKF